MLAPLFLFFKGKGRIDPLAIATSASVVDLEVLYYLLIGEWTNHHRIWHSYFIAVAVFPVIISLALYFVERRFDKKLSKAYDTLKLKPPRAAYSLPIIYVSCLIGGFSHIFFDMFTHQSLPYVAYPFLVGNPFYIGDALYIVEGLAIGLAVYSLYLWWKTSKPKSES